MPKIDDARLNALRPKPKPSENPPEAVRTPSDDGIDSMGVDKVPTERTLRKGKEKVVKYLKKGANEKEKKSFQKRVFRIPLEKPFDGAYYTHRLWIFFRETKETEEDIRRMFCEAREQMRKRVTLKKKSDPCILPRVMADHLGLQVEPSKELFTFVDYSQRNSGGIVRDLEVQIGNALVPVDFHVLDIKMNWNSSLILGRAFLSTVGAVCNLQTNQLCLTLIDPHVHYNPSHRRPPEESMIQESLQHATCNPQLHLLFDLIEDPMYVLLSFLGFPEEHPQPMGKVSLLEWLVQGYLENSFGEAISLLLINSSLEMLRKLFLKVLLSEV
ncbi:hypothetical protein F2Q69_00029640 [Brassica cretica]|uniref:Uncharacterized protein n=1 Tax=Brassica cretica TaxID=69181 RepID=A0A8S9S0L6_BRACR|nr:hypothetical protein F2Q69_00029640 [Brassica cretica]